MIQVIFRTQLIKLFISINSTQAFYLLKVSWKIRSYFRFNPYQNLMRRKKFKIFVIKGQLPRTIPTKVLKVNYNTSAETFIESLQ